MEHSLQTFLYCLWQNLFWTSKIAGRTVQQEALVQRFTFPSTCKCFIISHCRRVYYFVLISPHYFYSFPVMLFKITRSLLTLSPSKSRVPELTPSISSFFYQYWCCLWYEAKVWCRDSLKFLSSFCIFQLFWDRNCCISWQQTNLLSWSGGPGSRLFSLQAVEHLDRGIKYPDIATHMATWTSTHHFLTETNVMYSQLRIAYTHERWGIHFLSHDGETRGTHTNPTLHPLPTGSLEALTLIVTVFSCTHLQNIKSQTTWKRWL